MEQAQGILEGLDERQRRAAMALGGPVRIIAGAGAGKTRTITRRIAYACATGAWNPSQTLAVTFSVKAAGEMRARLDAFEATQGVRAATFHSAALHQLNEAWEEVCDAPFPHLTETRQDIVRRALSRVSGRSDADFDALVVRDVAAEINWTKVSLVPVSQYARVCEAERRMPPAGLSPERFAEVIDAYEAEKTSRDEIDFDDILLLTCHVMDDFPEAAARIRERIGWLTVDEYQDVSPLQHRLMMLWLGGGRERGEVANRNVCVVGDPAQTIYSFAGASSYGLMNFAEEFGPLSADIGLNTDFRSTPQIVRCANHVLASSPQREDYLKLVSAREPGARITRRLYDSDEDEAVGVASIIGRLVAKGAKPSDCAVLTRVNAQQPVIGAALRRGGLKFRVRRDSGWQSAVLTAGNDGIAAAGAGQTSQRSDDTGILASHADPDPGVTISTIHASKGLEFKHVFVIGCSEGLLPYGSPGNGEALEEERRLMYVGVTRAEDTLHLSYARSKDGLGTQQRVPSRFL